ncbi:MAG: hypothetical protein ABSE63_00900 [Thermoguttaceae bacterium]|jgi:hypothetical protein
MYKNKNNPAMEANINERMALNGSLELSMAEYIGDALFNAIPQDHKAIAAQLLLISKIKQNCLKSSYSESELLGKAAVIQYSKKMVEIFCKYLVGRFDGWELVADDIVKELTEILKQTKNE